MAKRQGLGRASTSKPKHQKTEEPDVEVELPDLNDEELSEAYGLYEKLRAQRDLRIARGLVHECDALLRARDAKGANLPPRFHAIYAGALFTLAADAADAEFAAAAFDRLSRALEVEAEVEAEAKAEAAALGDALGVAIHELAQYAHTQKESRAEGRRAKEQALELLKRAEKEVHNELEVARGADVLTALLEDRGEVVELPVLKKLAESTDAETKRLANKSLGQLASAEANLLLDIDELSKEQEKEAKKLLERTAEHLKKALSESDPQTYVHLAETLLALEDFTDSSSEEPLKLLKKARLLGAEGLGELISELEGDGDLTHGSE